MMATKKILDTNVGCGLAWLQPASNREENSASTPVSIVVFFRPEFKGVPGSVPNILNKDAAWLSAVRSSPVLFRESILRRDNYHV